MHWICRLLWVVQAFWQYWFFQAKNMVYLPISLYHISYLPSVPYRFFSSYGFSLGKFIPRYLILFDALLNGILSLFFLSKISLLVYRKVRGFCVLFLYPATLPSSLMSSRSFLVTPLGFPIYSILSSANSDSFTSSFPIYISFIYLF